MFGFGRLKLWWRYLFNPLRCPEEGCGLRCKSVQGLGRHRAAHARQKQAELPLLTPPPEVPGGG